MSGGQPTIAVMQGRLLPPRDGRLQSFPGARWPEEFELAGKAGVDAIEWIVDGAENPLDTQAGAREVAAVADATGVEVSSLCADRLMERPLARGTAAELAERLALLERLVERAAAVGAGHVTVPFVDASALEEGELDVAVRQLEAALPAARAAGVELHLETALDPQRFAELLDRVPEVRVTYDAGNSAALGFDPRKEFAAFGDRIGSVHVKDRLAGGGSVPLGDGNAELDVVLAELRRREYDGVLVLQVARGPEGAEVDWVRGVREDVERRWREAA